MGVVEALRKRTRERRSEKLGASKAPNRRTKKHGGKDRRRGNPCGCECASKWWAKREARMKTEPEGGKVGWRGNLEK